MIKMVLATGNEHKAEEFEDLFAGSKFKVFSAAKFGGMPKVIENGKTFQSNAYLKAFALSKQLKNKLKTKNLLVTRGKNGAILINDKNQLIECPAYANNVVDRVGAGDSMLSIISLLVKIGAPHDLSLLLGSFAGAASVESIGNSTFLKKKNFLRHLEFALK